MKSGILCFLALMVVIGVFYVFWVIKGGGEDD